MTRFLLLTALALPFFSGCSSHGKKVTQQNVEVFYLSPVTKAEADKVLNYLIQAGWADGSRKSVQLKKNGNRYEFRMVIKTGYDSNQSFLDACKEMTRELSRDIFNGAEVDVNLCDQHLKTIKVVPYAPPGT